MGPLREQPHSVLCGRKDVSTRSRLRAQWGAPFAPPSPDLDREYITQWAEALGVADLWRRLTDRA